MILFPWKESLKTYILKEEHVKRKRIVSMKKKSMCVEAR